MKRLFSALVLCFLLIAQSTHAITVYYQPTPYPLKKMDTTAMLQDIEKVHIWDGWFNSYYPEIQTFQRDDKLQIGGWGDTYTSPIRFDLAGLPRTVDGAYLYLLPLGTPFRCGKSVASLNVPHYIIVGYCYDRVEQFSLHF